MAASADITRVSPTQFDLYVEDFIHIHGTNLLGTQSTVVLFDGLYAVEPSFADANHLIVFVPGEIIVQEGTHTLVVQSIDGAGVRTHGPVSFIVSGPVIEPGGPPILSLPEIVVEEAKSRSGAEVTFDASAVDATGAVAVTCTPASGATFPLGGTSVLCSATNAAGTSTGRFFVLVTDTTPPVVTVPDNIVTDNPVVTFEASAVDNVDGTLPVSCSPASGATFAQGSTLVRCTAIDAHFNRTTETFRVTVTGGPPAIFVPDDVVEEATGPTGAVVTYEATTDDGAAVSCSHASGATFPLGTTAVTCTASNTAGSSSATFQVTVIDTTPPRVTAPSLLEVEATSAAGAIGVFVATAHDLVDGDVAVTCAPPSGSQFPFGTTDVFCTASDSRLNTESAFFQVIVQDTTAPVVTQSSATPGTLWPPNHQMIDVTISATLSDADPSPTVKIVSVSSNQPTQGTGDGDTPNDWVITGPMTLQLRSERSQGKERIYTITLETRDASGNVGTATVQVRVSDPRRRPVSAI
jgi:HYR domain